MRIRVTKIETLDLSKIFKHTNRSVQIIILNTIGSFEKEVVKMISSQ